MAREEGGRMRAKRGLVLLLFLRLSGSAAAFAFSGAWRGVPGLLTPGSRAFFAASARRSAPVLGLQLPRSAATRCQGAEQAGADIAAPSQELALHVNATAQEIRKEIEAIMEEPTWRVANDSITSVLSRLQTLRERLGVPEGSLTPSKGASAEACAVLACVEAAAHSTNKLLQATQQSEVAWSEMVEELGMALDHFSARLAPAPHSFFLGMGAARVFKVVLAPHGPACSFAVLKLYPWQQGTWGEDEVKTLQKLKDDGVFPKGRMLGHAALLSGAFALLTSNVGVPILEPCSEADVEGMFVSLSKMHRLGWSHGDARVPNFIVVGGVVEPIDFEMSLGRGEASVDEVREDMWRLAASVFGLSGTLNLFNNPKDVIADDDGLGEEVSRSLEETIGAYSEGGYQERDAQAIAGIVFRGTCASP